MIEVSCCTSHSVRKVDCKFFVVCWGGEVSAFLVYLPQIWIVLDIGNAYLAVSQNMKA